MKSPPHFSTSFFAAAAVPPEVILARELYDKVANTQSEKEEEKKMV